MAKLVIRLINDVASTINADARVGKLLKVVFLPNYSVSLAEIIMPAADLSEQISTAGTEASGTGNMKFALNGALTIGTLDGANVEMRDNVGAGEHLHLRQHHARSGRHPRTRLPAARNLRRERRSSSACSTRSATARFQPGEPARYQGIYDALVNWGDHYLLLADYASYVAKQAEVDALYRDSDAWTRMAILNVAGMGAFSSDRTIAQYAHEIWHTKPVVLGQAEPPGFFGGSASVTKPMRLSPALFAMPISATTLP